MNRIPRWTLFIGLAVALLIVILIAMIHHRQKPILQDWSTPTAIDFQGRLMGAFIPPGWFGIGGVGSTVSDPNAIAKFTKIHMLGNRIWAEMTEIYKNGPTPDFSLFDKQMDRGTQDGLDPIVVLDGTPPFLQGPSGRCSKPTDVNAWAEAAAAVAEHVEKSHPKLHYEIWNEPDSQASLCTDNQLNDYIEIYLATAPKVKKAAPTSEVGGPALCCPAKDVDTFLTPLLADNRVTPYIDFVSWHVYLTGSWEAENGMQWDYSTGMASPMFDIMQGPTTGWSYYYRKVDAAVRAGGQPNAKNTPTYLTEYNVSHQTMGHNCCQNDYRYGPLWNAVAYVDLMTTQQDGAIRGPDKINFYMSHSANLNMCAIGPINGASGSTIAGDCGDVPEHCDNGVCTGDYTEYPQYQAFQMFTSPDYLNLEDTNFYVLTRPQLPNNMLGAVLWNATSDMLVIINQTGENLGSQSYTFANTGFHSALQAHLYQIANGFMLTKSLPLAMSDLNTVAAVVTIPAYSVTAIKIEPGQP